LSGLRIAQFAASPSARRHRSALGISIGKQKQEQPVSEPALDRGQHNARAAISSPERREKQCPTEKTRETMTANR
jgi:hypothetical protein